MGNKLVRARQYPWGVVQGECGWEVHPQLGVELCPLACPAACSTLCCFLLMRTCVPTLTLESARLHACLIPHWPSAFSGE